MREKGRVLKGMFLLACSLLLVLGVSTTVFAADGKIKDEVIEETTASNVRSAAAAPQVLGTDIELNKTCSTGTIKLTNKQRSGNTYYYNLDYWGNVNGIRVKLYNNATKSLIDTKYITRTGFSLTLSKNKVYKVSVTPYIYYNGTRSYGKSVSSYVMLPPTLASHNVVGSSGERIAWNKISGASGYYVYVKRPGSSYKKVAKTTSTSYTVRNMAINKTYYIKVVAYKKVGSKYYKSDAAGWNFKLYYRY